MEPKRSTRLRVVPDGTNVYSLVELAALAYGRFTGQNTQQIYDALASSFSDVSGYRRTRPSLVSTFNAWRRADVNSPRAPEVDAILGMVMPEGWAFTTVVGRASLASGVPKENMPKVVEAVQQLMHRGLTTAVRSPLALVPAAATTPTTETDQTTPAPLDTTATSSMRAELDRIRGAVERLAWIVDGMEGIDRH